MVLPRMSVGPAVRLAAFRFRSRSRKPVDGFLNFAHTHPLGNVDVPFGVNEISPT